MGRRISAVDLGKFDVGQQRSNKRLAGCSTPPELLSRGGNGECRSGKNSLDEESAGEHSGRGSLGQERKSRPESEEYLQTKSTFKYSRLASGLILIRRSCSLSSKNQFLMSVGVSMYSP